MSDTQEARKDTGAAPEAGADRTAMTGWAGWLLFAGVIVVMAGVFQVTMGVVALFSEDYYKVPSSGLLVPVSYTIWGWFYVIFGTAAVTTGFGLMVGRMWARIIGVVLAVISATVNLAFIAAYPLWAVLVIAFDLITIYAIAVHGNEVADAGDG